MQGDNKIHDFDEDIIKNTLNSTNIDARQAYLREAQNTTYNNNDYYVMLREKPYLNKGIIFEGLVTGNIDPSTDLILYEHLRGKENNKWRSDILKELCAEYPHKLPISNKDLYKLKELVDKIHNTRLSSDMRIVTGFDDLGSLFFSEHIMYSYKIDHDVTINGRKYNMTGECDAVLPINDGEKHMIFEFKTSSKMYYPNHINKIVRHMNYDFQVMFYTYLLSLKKMNPIKYVTFLMANPSNGVYKYLPFDITAARNYDKFKRVMKSL